jgi:hypothetical protein
MMNSLSYYLFMDWVAYTLLGEAKAKLQIARSSSLYKQATHTCLTPTSPELPSPLRLSHMIFN